MRDGKFSTFLAPARMEAGAALHLRLSDGSTRDGAVLFAHDPATDTRFIVNQENGGRSKMRKKFMP